MEQLYDWRGQRKYLTEQERNRFRKAARSTGTPVRVLCEVLTFTGRLVSEALALTPERVDPAAGFLVFESLKKSRRGIFRAVPVPTGLLETLSSPTTAQRPQRPDVQAVDMASDHRLETSVRGDEGGRSRRTGRKPQGLASFLRHHRCRRSHTAGDDPEMDGAQQSLDDSDLPRRGRHRGTTDRLPTVAVGTQADSLTPSLAAIDRHDESRWADGPGRLSRCVDCSAPGP